jgi:hypothetical protein
MEIEWSELVLREGDSTALRDLVLHRMIGELAASVRVEGYTWEELLANLHDEFPEAEAMAEIEPVEIEVIIGARGGFGWGYTPQGPVPDEMAGPSRGRSAFEVYVQNLARADLMRMHEETLRR